MSDPQNELFIKNLVTIYHATHYNGYAVGHGYSFDLKTAEDKAFADCQRKCREADPEYWSGFVHGTFLGGS